MNYMQISTDKISFNGYVKRSQIDRKTENQDVLQEPQELSNYEVGQAVLNRNNISFRKIQKPIEVTEKYNKRIEGKNHLDLPNIHVYEYPDTNLQLFVNEVNKTTNKDFFNASLSFYDKGIKNDSVIKKKLLMALIRLSFNKNNINAQVNENYEKFLNIDLNCNISDLNKIGLLNKLITKPNFSESDLQLCKENLINTVKSEKYQREMAEFKKLVEPSLFNTTADTIENIQNITLKDVYSYYSEILKNTEAQYAVTVDKSYINEDFYSSLNVDLTNKFKKHSEKNVIYSEPVLNKEDIRNYDNNNESFLTFHYPVQVKSNKDFLTYKYLTFLEFFWREPYIAEDFAVQKYTLPMELKSNATNLNKLGYLNFSFVPKGNENIPSTEDAIVLFKALLETLHDEKLSDNTLESIKEQDKQFFDEQLNYKADSDLSHEIIKYYGKDIFKIYEIIDDIKIENIRDILEYIMLEQKPVITINEEKNPYNLKG